MIRYLCCILLFTLYLCAWAAEPIVPANLAWYAQWQDVQKSRLLHPALKNAVANIPLKSPDEMMQALNIDFTDISEKRIGYALISRDGTSLLAFRYMPSDSRQIIGQLKLNEILQEQAKEIANQFLKVLPPLATEGMVLTECKGPDREGTFSVTFTSSFADIRLAEFHISVNRDKNVVGYGRGEFVSREAKEKYITPSPGEQVARAAIMAELAKQNIDNAEITTLHRNLDYQKKPVLFWNGQVQYEHEGRLLSAWCDYYESDKKVVIYKWSSSTLQNSPPDKEPEVRKGRLFADGPAWSPDGKQIWWSTNARWERLPGWFMNSTTSLGVTDVATRTTSLYRPLVDYETVPISYGASSLSPDGRWLACMSKYTALFIDLQYNRLYALKKQYYVTNRISWNNDSSFIAFVEHDLAQAFLVQVTGKSGIPFDAQERKLPIDGEVALIEFLPNATDAGIVAYRPRDQRGNEKGWRIAILQVLKEGGIKLESIVSDISRPLRLHINPNSESFIYINETGGIQVTINTGKSIPVPTFTQGKKIAGDAVIDVNFLNWAYSPDGEQIAFTAETPWGSAIYLTLLDKMDTFTCITPKDPEIELPRYRVQEKFALIPKAFVPEVVLESLKLIDSLEWPENILPANGPWFRK